ncbi:MAG: monovalent cation/H+ antiporter subunit D family protein [Nannocystaceae bacterium]
MNLADHLPVLIVLLPLFGGALSLFTGANGWRPWTWALLITGSTFATSLALLEAVRYAPRKTLIYALGSWPGEYGIEYRVDVLNAYVLCVVSLLALVCTVYARRSIEDEIPDDRHHMFYAVWLLAIAGLLGITVTGDTFNIYVLLEISSLTVYCLIAMGKDRDRRALTASLKYLILGSIGATFILLGIGYLLMLTGTLNMADMHAQLMEMRDRGELLHNRTVLIAFAFLMVGLALKMALFPLHQWLPNAYTYAPSAVSALIASTATKVGVYMTFRFVFTLFGGVYDSLHNLDVFIACACAGVLVSGVRAAQQNNAKRVLAYSSVGQLAYIVLGFSLLNHSGVTASVIHIFNHAVTKGGMFMALGCVAYRVGGTEIRHLQGIGRRMPLTMAAFVAGGLGLIGMPLTAGFVSKWYLVQAALDEGFWWVAFVVLLGSLLALIYVWRLVEVIYFKAPDPQYADKDIREAPLTMLVPTWSLIGASIYFGIDASWTAEIADAAARTLLGGFS